MRIQEQSAQSLFEFCNLHSVIAMAEENVLAVDGIIGLDVMAADIRAALKGFKNKPIRVDISSPGGFISEGLTIYNLLRNYKGHVETRLTGIAASMASIISLAGDKRTACSNAVFMIHNARGISMGDHRDLRKTADVLEQFSAVLASTYVDATDHSEKEIRRMMDEETWFFGDEILEAGFVEEIIESGEKDDRKTVEALAHDLIESCASKMRDSNVRRDIDRAAAMLSEITPKNAIENLPPKERAMTLAEYLAANPSAKIEFDHAIKTSKEEGFNGGKKSVEERIERAAKFLGNDSAYPQAIRDLAVSVIKGEKTPDSLEAAIIYHDMAVEAIKSQMANTETNQIPDVRAQQSNLAAADGIVRDEATLQAEIARAKGVK